MTKPYYEDEAVTLYHGDAREIAPSLPSPDMIWTDPPYGHNNNNGDLIHKWEEALGRGSSPQEVARPIDNDGAEEAGVLARWLFAFAADKMASGGCCCCCCCCGGGGPDPMFARWSLWMDEPLEFKQMVIWDKGPMGMGWHYRRSYETVLVGMKRPGPCRWYDDTDRVENILRDIPKIIPRDMHHPTEKPLRLPAHFIRLHSKPGDLVLDPFCGAGGSLVAAKRMGRRGVGIDTEEKWLEMAAERLRQRILWAS